MSAPAESAPHASPPANWRRGFWSLFVVQFQGAFSDNVFKFLVIFLIARTVSDDARDNYISLILALFSLPFLLFSMAAGYLADRYPKPKVIIGTKALEILIMLVGTYGLYCREPVVLATVLFFMSVQSAFFGPSKYGILPELLPRDHLSWGNGFLGLGTFLSIILGGILAGFLSDKLGLENAWFAGVGLVALAATGFTISRMIPTLPAADPKKEFHVNFLAELWANLKIIRQDRILKLALIGSVYFWFLGALFGEPTVLVYGQDVLQVDDTKISILRAFLAVGIAAGCGLAGWLSGRHIEYGLVPLGAFGMAGAALVLFFPGLDFVIVGVTLLVMGIFGGLYTIPINTLLQARPDPKIKGSVMATNGWLTSAGVFAAAGIFWFLKSLLGLSPNAIFLIGATVTAAVGAYAVHVTRHALLSFVMRIARGEFQHPGGH